MYFNQVWSFLKKNSLWVLSSVFQGSIATARYLVNYYALRSR